MTIPLVGPDGRKYELDNGDPKALQNVLNEGFRVLQPGEDTSALEDMHAAALDATQTVGAAGAGALSGLTAGAFPVAVTALHPSALLADDSTDKTQARERAGRETAAQLKALKDENPIAYGVGDFAGMAASPLSEIGGAAAKGIGATSSAGKLAARVAGDASVGALFSAGTTVSDAVLGNQQLNAEKLLSSAGLGALLGAGGGLAGAALEAGASKVLPALSKLSPRAASILDELANDSAIKSTRATQGELSKFSKEELANAAKVMRERGHIDWSPEKMGERVSVDRKAVGESLGKFLDDAEAAGAKPSHADFLKRLDEFEAKLNPLERDAIASDLAAARKSVTEVGARPVDAVGKEGSGFRALDDIKQTMQARAKFSKGPVPLDDVTMGLKRKLAGVFRDELDRQLLPQLGSDVAKGFTETKAVYGGLKTAQRLAEMGAKRPGGPTLKELITGGALFGVHPGLGAAATVGQLMWRKYGDALVAKFADKLAGSPALNVMARSFAQRVPQVAAQMGEYGSTLVRAAERGGPHVLATHMAMAQMDPAYAATAQLAGLTPESQGQHFASINKASGIATVAAALKEHDDAIDRYLEHVVKAEKAPVPVRAMTTQDFGSKRMRREALDGHNQRATEVRQLASDPQALIDRVSKNLGGVGDVAPGIASAMTAVAQRAVQYLAKESATPPKAGPLAREWTPTEAERHSFAMKLEVVQQPMAVMRHASAGTLTRGQLEALQAVYPTLARDIQDRALMRLSESPRDVPYKARLMLSKLAGIDVDGTMGQRAIAANQTAIAKGAGKPSEQMGQPAPKDGKLTLAARMATPGQRREIEGEKA